MSSPGSRPRRHAPTAAEGRITPPGPSSVDLHAHTLRSDGVMEPGALVGAAYEAGVRTFSLTDHDTLAGYREVVASRVVPAGMTLIPGIEINALVTRDLGLWEGELHILGFGVDPDDDEFEAAMAHQRDQRRIRFAQTVDRLRDLGMPIDAQVADLDASDGDALGRPTIARALIRAGFASTVEDAFTRLIGHGAPGYVRREGLGPEDAIRVIRAAGGIPVLAHFREAPTRIELLRELMDVGLAGLEVFYRSFDAASTVAVGEVATVLGLLATGGTDYHGDLGPYADSHATVWVPPEVAEALLRTLGRV